MTSITTRPWYPDESRMAHEEGVVMLRVEVTAAGEAVSVIIQQSSGYFRLDQVARQELGYCVQLSAFAYAQPDLQYIVQPGGTGNIPNAVILAAQFGLAF